MIPQNKLVIIKVGSQVLFESHSKNQTSKKQPRNNQAVEKQAFKDLAKGIKLLRENQNKVILVSSGAIAASSKILSENKILNEKNYKDANKQNIAILQAKSALGQSELIQLYTHYFKSKGIKPAQVLLTNDDLKNRKRILNIKATLHQLLDWDILPIVNENDTISFREITVGDNDHLTAALASLLQSDYVYYISRAEGLYSHPPEHPEAKLLSRVDFDFQLDDFSTAGKSQLGRGGMRSKLEAIQKCTNQGIHVLLGNQLCSLLKKDSKGTYFAPNPSLKSKTFRKGLRKDWIRSTARPDCRLIVDKGCAEALVKNRSLLPAGILKVEGDFSRGDSVTIKFNRKTIAFGLVEYSSSEIEQIKGQQARVIAEKLRYKTRNEVVHKDNLVLKDKIL